MNECIGEFPVPQPRESYLAETEEDVRPGRTMSEYHSAQRRYQSTSRAAAESVKDYHEGMLADSSGEPELDPIPPIGSEGAVVRWIINSIANNDIHSQRVMDAAMEKAIKAGMSAQTFLDLARIAIRDFAHERGRF